jgi:phosphoglucosamine mutase
MSRKYFGTDGVRGRSGSFPSPRILSSLGHAAGRVLVITTRSPTDGADRQGHPHFRLHAGSALEAGFTAAGVNVLLTGPLPTPGMAYLPARCGWKPGW